MRTRAVFVVTIWLAACTSPLTIAELRDGGASDAGLEDALFPNDATTFDPDGDFPSISGDKDVAPPESDGGDADAPAD